MAPNPCLLNYNMSDKKIKVPNIGDFKDVEVIEVLVSSGQSIKKNDPLITIESDKSSVEIPSPEDGKIKSLKIKIGDKISEGNDILILETKDKNNVEQTGRNVKKKEIQKQKEEINIKETIKQELKIKDISGMTSEAPKHVNLQESLV